MIPYLTHEYGPGVLVIRILVISARAPEVVFRNILFLASGLVGLLAEIWRTRQIRPRRIIFIQNLRDYLAADNVPVRIDTELRKHPEQGVVILVVARPDRDARMAAELQHHLPYFIADLGSELFALRIYDSRHREILPYHYALTVAPVVERLVFIDVSAPAADHVAVQVGDHVYRAVHPLVVAAVEAVERHPVSAAGEYLLAVYIEAEAPGSVPVDVSHLQPDRPETHFPGVGREDLAAVVRKGDRTVVQGRIPISFRPP